MEHSFHGLLALERPDRDVHPPRQDLADLIRLGARVREPRERGEALAAPGRCRARDLLRFAETEVIVRVGEDQGLADGLGPRLATLEPQDVSSRRHVTDGHGLEQVPPFGVSEDLERHQVQVPVGTDEQMPPTRELLLERLENEPVELA